MASKPDRGNLQNLPACAVEFIKLVIKKMRYRRKVQQDVQAELAAHFEDELKNFTTDEEKEQKAQQLIAEFGDMKLLAVLLRRAKKRCRPLWRTVVARTFQAIGVLILCFILYVVWFFSGKPLVTIDYVAELNRTVQPIADESLNAAPFYNEAASRYEKLSKDNKEIFQLLSKNSNEATPEQKQLIEKWLTDNEETLELVITGSQKPYHWPEYKTGKEDDGVMGVLMPHLSEFRRLVYSLLWRAQLSAEQGRYEDAFDDIKSCYRFGQHLRGNKTIIEQLVGIAIEALAVQTLRDILSEYQTKAAALATLQKDFEQIITGEDFIVSLKAEKMFLYDEIQRCFTADRIGEGHLYLPRVIALGGGVQKDLKLDEILVRLGTPLLWPVFTKVLFTHPNKRQTREMADRLYASWDKMVCRTPTQIREEAIDIKEEAMKIAKGNIFLEPLTPAIVRVIEIGHRNKTEVQATITILGLLRHKKDKGYYPENLQELITTGYLKELPIDSYSDKPLNYKKTDDNFTLYSVGPNFTDDGGEPGKDSKGRISKWRDNGDTVFWPVPEM